MQSHFHVVVILHCKHFVKSLQEIGRPIQLVFYENAGHLLFEGPLKKVSVRRGDAIAFTAYEGAGEGVLEQYERDAFAFVNRHLAQENP